MKKETHEPNWDELRQEREIQKGIEKQEKEHMKIIASLFDPLKSNEELEAMVDNNPDDGSWKGR